VNCLFKKMKFNFNFLPAYLLNVPIVLLLISQINKEALYYHIMHFFNLLKSVFEHNWFPL